MFRPELSHDIFSYYLSLLKNKQKAHFPSIIASAITSHPFSPQEYQNMVIHSQITNEPFHFYLCFYWRKYVSFYKTSLCPGASQCRDYSKGLSVSRSGVEFGQRNSKGPSVPRSGVEFGQRNSCVWCVQICN